MAIPGNVGGKKSTFSSPATMAQAQRSAESQSMKALQDRREQTRQDFFKGRPDISPNRLDRRQIQADLYEKFKQEQMKPVVGASNVYQSRTPGGPTLADEAMRLANMYGPTFKEIGSDIGYGLGSIGRGIGNFIGKGGVLGSVASDLFQRIKSGTQQGIETVGGLYDNLRKTLGGEPPVVNYGGSSDITVTEQPMFPYNFETIMKPKPDPLLPSEMSQEQFMESYPELYSENPLFKQQNFQPIRVSDMDMSGVVASNAGQNIIGNLQNLQNLAQQYNLNKIQFDPFNPNRIGYKDQFMYNNTPVNYNIGIGNQGVEAGLNFAFKKGGSVDKYAGLGYKLK
jgi:hypothetical protein